MLINLRNALMTGKRTPTAKDYVQDGLIAMWDGIENAGWGVHDAAATGLENLVGGGLNISLSGNYTINADNVRFNGGYGIADRYDFTGANGATISVLASYDSTGALNANGWTYAGTGARLGAYWESNGWWLSASSTSAPPKIATSFTVNTVERLDFIWDVSGSKASLFSNGAFIGDGSYNFTLGAVLNRFRMMTYGNTSDGNFGVSKGNVYNCAVYSRALTAAEIAANYAIDKARFGLS